MTVVGVFLLVFYQVILLMRVLVGRGNFKGYTQDFCCFSPLCCYSLYIPRKYTRQRRACPRSASSGTKAEEDKRVTGEASANAADAALGGKAPRQVLALGKREEEEHGRRRAAGPTAPRCPLPPGAPARRGRALTAGSAGTRRAPRRPSAAPRGAAAPCPARRRAAAPAPAARPGAPAAPRRPLGWSGRSASPPPAACGTAPSPLPPPPRREPPPRPGGRPAPTCRGPAGAARPAPPSAAAAPPPPGRGPSAQRRRRSAPCAGSRAAPRPARRQGGAGRRPPGGADGGAARRSHEATRHGARLPATSQRDAEPCATGRGAFPAPSRGAEPAVASANESRRGSAWPRPSRRAPWRGVGGPAPRGAEPARGRGRWVEPPGPAPAPRLPRGGRPLPAAAPREGPKPGAAAALFPQSNGSVRGRCCPRRDGSAGLFHKRSLAFGYCPLPIRLLRFSRRTGAPARELERRGEKTLTSRNGSLAEKSNCCVDDGSRFTTPSRQGRAFPTVSSHRRCT